MLKEITSRLYTITMGRSGSTIGAGAGGGVGTRRQSSSGQWEVWRWL